MNFVYEYLIRLSYENHIKNIFDNLPIYYQVLKYGLIQNDFKEYIFLSLFYILLKIGLKYYVKSDEYYNRNKKIFDKIIFGYNMMMALFSLYCFIKMLGIVLYELDNYGLALDNYSNENFRNVIKIFYYSKYVEYLDTFFLLIKNKKISWLQSYHHFFAPLCFGLDYYTNNNIAFIPVLLNSFIHFDMSS